MQLMRFHFAPYVPLKEILSTKTFPNLSTSTFFRRTEASSSRERESSQEKANLCMRRKFMQKAFDFFMQIIQRLFKPELSYQKSEKERDRKREKFLNLCSKRLHQQGSGNKNIESKTP